jgi:hypothetical protein
MQNNQPAALLAAAEDTREQPSGATGSGTSTPVVPSTPELGGPPGPEPTRFGDWESKGRCIDF